MSFYRATPSSKDKQPGHIGLKCRLFLCQLALFAITVPLSVDFTQASGTPTAVSAEKGPNLGRDQLLAIYRQALADDSSGRHEQARKWFDALLGSELASTSAVPSAVNFAYLGRYTDARLAFGRIVQSSNPRDSTYAQLWQLWLTARTWSGSSNGLRKQLATDAKAITANDAPHQALVDLYAGSGNLAAVQSAVNASAGNDPNFNDLRAEAAFFAGGWSRYVVHDDATALLIYLNALPQAANSLERPLLAQAVNELQPQSTSQRRPTPAAAKGAPLSISPARSGQENQQ